MVGPTPTQTLHRLTSFATYDPDRVWEPPVDDPRVVRDLAANDFDRLPWFYKRYDSAVPLLPLLPLPRELPRTATPTVAVLGGTADVDPRPLDLAHLSRLLHLSAGVVRTTERRVGASRVRWLFRAAGSAGARFPLEVYVAVPTGTGLPPGVHWYHPEKHALVRIGPPPSGVSPTVILTGVPWRTGWRYRERGYRHVYWDAGTMLSQLLAAADSVGLDPHLYSRFPDAAVADLVGADRVHEWPVAVVSLGAAPPALGAASPAATGQVDAAPVEFPLVTAAQRAGELDGLGEPWDRGAPAAVSIEHGDPVERVVLSRGSIRLLDLTRGLEPNVLGTAMPAALRGIGFPHFVAVHDVGALEPGLYRWPELSTPRRTGNLRGELYRVAMEQGLARDAAFVAIGAADVGALDDRGYRDAQLAAGVVEGRLHLLAVALGAAASGMTFVDGDIAGLLGEPLDGLLFTCVGVPEYSSAPGGLPGTPTSIRTVAPRE